MLLSSDRLEGGNGRLLYEGIDKDIRSYLVSRGSSSMRIQVRVAYGEAGTKGGSDVHLTHCWYHQQQKNSITNPSSHLPSCDMFV